MIYGDYDGDSIPEMAAIFGGSHGGIAIEKFKVDGTDVKNAKVVSAGKVVIDRGIEIDDFEGDYRTFVLCKIGGEYFIRVSGFRDHSDVSLHESYDLISLKDMEYVKGIYAEGPFGQTEDMGSWTVNVTYSDYKSGSTSTSETTLSVYSEENRISASEKYLVSEGLSGEDTLLTEMSEGVTDHTGFIEKYYMNPDAGKASEKESANDDQKKDDSESDGLQKKEDKSEKNSSEWKAAYTDIVNEFESKSNEYGDDFERQYDLVYIDDDDIPELICTFNSTSEMSSFYSGELYTCIDGKVVMLSDAIYGPSGAGGNNFDTLFFERRNVILKESVSEAGASFYSVISQINIQNKNLDTIELCSAAYDKEKYSSTIDAGQDIANEHKFFFKDGKSLSAEEFNNIKSELLSGDPLTLKGTINKDAILNKLK